MLHHITRAVRRSQLEDCIAFYRLLGFELVPPPPGIRGRAVWLESRNGSLSTQIHLMPGEEADPPSGHFAVVCAPYEEVVERLRDAGHDVEPRREHWGAPRSYVHDPAGNLVELMADPPRQQRQ